MPPGPFTSNGRTFKAPQIQSFSAFDSVYRILATLRRYESGEFFDAALLMDAMGRDDRIDGVLRTRVDSLLQAQLDIKPVDESRKATKAADMLGGVEDGPGEWDRMIPDGVAAKLLRSGLCLNFALAEIVWSYQGGMWWPTLNFWHTQHVRWDWTKECYVVRGADGTEQDLPRLDQNPVGNGRWFVWCPFGYKYAWLDGMIRSLAPLFMRRMNDNRDWARSNEAYGLPIRKAIVPMSGNDEEKDQFFEDVANMNGDPAVMVPQGEEGNQYDVELVALTTQIFQTFKESKADANSDIAILVLGQNLTTEASGGGLGDGGASVHRRVQLDKAKRDASFAGAIRDQVLVPWAQYNFKDPSLAPLPIYRVEPEEDATEKAVGYKAVGDALQSLRLAKAPVDDRALLEEFGVPVFTEEEIAAQQAVDAEQGKASSGLSLTPSTQGAVVTVNEARSSSGLGPLLGENGAPDPDGNISVSEYAARLANKAKSGGNQQGAEDGTPAAALRASVGKHGRRMFVESDVVKRYEFAGLSIAVEHPAGTVRQFTDDAGAVTGQVNMLNDYGFIEGHLGADGDELDCYMGPNEAAPNVHVVHQLRAPVYKVHDEDKTMLGFDSEADARVAYLAHRPDGDKSLGGISVIPIDRFKAKLTRRRGGGIIRARADFDPTVAAIMALADKGTAMLRGATTRKKKAYADQLTDKALQLGARALAADLAGVKAEIKEASSFEDLERRMVAYYRDKMDPAKLARIVQRSRLMANLSGRLTVKKGA